MQKLWGTRIGINRVWQGTSPRVLLFEPETVEVSEQLAAVIIDREPCNIYYICLTAHTEQSEVCEQESRLRLSASLAGHRPAD